MRALHGTTLLNNMIVIVEKVSRVFWNITAWVIALSRERPGVERWAPPHQSPRA